jgi:hypothetical protein
MTTHAPRAGRDRPPGPMFHATHDQREVHPMNAQIQLLQAVHADRIARLHAEARQARQARQARSARTDERRLRRALGRSLVRAGQRIAAEATAPDRTIEHVTPAGFR